MDDEFDGLGMSLLAAQDVLEAVLQEVDAAALRQLKAASVAWCAHVRRELCNRLWIRLSRREGQPEPAGVDSITDLDVECLNVEAGRPWEVVVAGRQLPQLARLHGYGFVVDVQAVREAYSPEAEDDDDDEEEEDEDDVAPIGGDTLLSCIQGEGQPPHTSCCSRLWPARRLGGCTGFLWSGCGRTMQSTSWTSVRPASASPERRCSPSCCRPRRLCAVSGTPSALC